MYEGWLASSHTRDRRFFPRAHIPTARDMAAAGMDSGDGVEGVGRLDDRAREGGGLGVLLLFLLALLLLVTVLVF